MSRLNVCEKRRACPVRLSASDPSIRGSALRAREILSDGAGDGQDKARTRRGFDHAQNPQDDGQQSEQYEQRDAQSKTTQASVAIVTISAESTHKESHAKHHSEHDADNGQAAEGDDGLRCVKANVGPLVDEEEDDSGEPP